ncbi:hypothetical protein R1flu_005937 [Riccia fluitans]|uniref:Glutamine amidotransferase type-2 domain-containing protein n=1 Tax=Riccia fluitans TaxID=41844 RepID=A0ABD1YUM3_9MARC
MHNGAIFWKERKIAYKDIGDFFHTTYENGGMKKIFEDLQTEHAVASVEAATNGIEVVQDRKDVSDKRM